MSDKILVTHLQHVAAAAQALAAKIENGGCWPGEQTQALYEIQKALDEAKKNNKDSPI